MSSVRLGTTSCQRKRPVSSSKHIRTPRSPCCEGSRGCPLLVPMYTRPPATMGVEWVSVPNSADHLMFRPVSGSKESGSPRSSETMLRDQAWPHCGWSAARHGKLEAQKAKPPISSEPRRLVFIGYDETGKPKEREGTRLSWSG